MAFDGAVLGRRRRRIPWPPLIALGACGVIGLIGLLPTQPLPTAAVLVQRDLRFVLPEDGSVDVFDAATNRLAGHLAPGGQSFVQGMVHGLQVGRRHHGQPVDGAYHLELLANGRFTMHDPETGTFVDLEGFGPNNSASFQTFMGEQR